MPKAFLSLRGFTPHQSEQGAWCEADWINRHAEPAPNFASNNHHLGLRELPRTMRESIKESLEEALDSGKFDF